MRPVNILFTSAGRRVELLRAFRRAYAELQLPGQIVALDMDPLAPALQFADRVEMVPAVSDPGFVTILRRVVSEARISLVLPLNDADVPVLAPLRAGFADAGTYVGTVAAARVPAVMDKYLTLGLFRELGLQTPATWLPGELSGHDAVFPLFLKPRRGSASSDTYKIGNAEQLAFFERYVPDAIIQEFLAGPEITSDVICDYTGDVLGVVCRRRIEVRSGEVAKAVTCFDPAIAEACRLLARALDARGPITVQGIMKDGVLHYTEVNARFGGGAPLGFAAGADAPRWLLARAAGLGIEIPPFGSYVSGVHMTRFDESVFLTTAPNGTFQSRPV